MRIFLLIRSLHHGGAERQLVTLARELCEHGHNVAVTVFYEGGPLEKELDKTDVRILSLGKRSRWDLIGFLWRAYRTLRREDPDILCSFLPTANLVSGLAHFLLPRLPVVWSLRTSLIDLASYDWVTRLTYRLERLLSPVPALITVNSYAGLQHHAKLGYPIEKMVVIPNGIDSCLFAPNVIAGRRLRQEWGIEPGKLLIGLVARIDPMKDYPTFLRAVESILNVRNDLRFVCVGDGPAEYREPIMALAAKLNLAERIIWAGDQDDMPAVYNAIDIATTSSRGEGLPNVIGEAMACGIPCVVTDVGDSAHVVGDTGIVVRPRDPEALAAGWQQMLQLSDSVRRELGARARQRIREKFSVAVMGENIGKVFEVCVR